jgi:HEAT repeat protein
MGVLEASTNSESIEKMLFDQAAEVRWMAARVLGRLNAVGSAEAILAVLNDSHAQVRLESAIALGYLHAQSAKQKLRELAANDPDPRVKEAAVYAASLIN